MLPSFPAAGAQDTTRVTPITARLIFNTLILHSTWFGNKMWHVDVFNLPEDVLLCFRSQAPC